MLELETIISFSINSDVSAKFMVGHETADLSALSC